MIQNGSSSPSVLVGKYSEASYCYFTSLDKYGNKRNGSASTGFEVATASAECGVEFTHRQSPRHFADNVVAAGIEPTAGASVGMCLVQNGEGAGSLIPGQLYLDGPRVGQCCWSANYEEYCDLRPTSFFLMVADGSKPVPGPVPGPVPPAIMPEPARKNHAICTPVLLPEMR